MKAPIIVKDDFDRDCGSGIVRSFSYFRVIFPDGTTRSTRLWQRPDGIATLVSLRRAYPTAENLSGKFTAVPHWSPEAFDWRYDYPPVTEGI